MTRKEKNKFINREITFPIKFDNQILTASPGDSVASALYHSNYQLSKGSIISSNREVVFQKKIREFISVDSGYQVDLGFDEILDQEAYPGLEIGPKNFFLDFNAKTLKNFSFFNSRSVKQIIDYFIVEKKNKQINSTIIENVEYLSSQILIVGGGISGLFAASILANAGLKIILLERDFIFGGFSNSSDQKVKNWIKKLTSDLYKSKNCTILKNTTLIYTDSQNNFFALRKIYKTNKDKFLKKYTILLKIVAEHVIIATGLKERTLPKINLNQSNILLASTVNKLVYRFGLEVKNNVVIYTNNDFGWETAFKLLDKGIEIKAIIDTRKDCNISINCPVFRGAQIIKTQGNLNVNSIKILDENNNRHIIKTSLIIVSGGFDLNLGAVSEIIDSLKWCSKNLTFIPKEYSSNLYFLTDFDNIYCLNSLIQNASKTSLNILKKYKAKGKNYEPLVFESKKINSELCQNNYFYNNKSFNFYNLIQSILFRSFLSNFNFKTEHGIKLNDLKLNAINVFSKDKLIQDEIKTNTLFNCGSSKVTLSFKDTQQTIDNNFSYQVNTPFRTTRCKEFYDKIGNIESHYNGWVLPKFFYKDKNNKDALISINQELSMTKKVGFSDESDLGKIAIVGQDTFKFLKSIKSMSDINLKEECFFTVYLKKGEFLFFDKLLVVVINKEYVLILLNSRIEKQFFDYLLSNLNSLNFDIKCSLFKESENFQVYSLVGSLSHKLLISKFQITNYSLSKKLKNKIYKFDYCGQEIFILFQKIGSELFANIIINSSFALKFIEDIYPNLMSLGGGLIGRESFEKIKLESGLISWNHLKKEELKMKTFSNNSKKENNHRFEANDIQIFPLEIIYSKMLYLIPIGLTKNIVIGSNVYSYKRGKKQFPLGKVTFCFYSIKNEKVIGLILFSKPINFESAIIENKSKNYQTICEVKKYDELFLGAQS